MNLVHFTNNTTPHPFITSIEPIDSKKCEERKKDSPLAQTICQASFRPIFLIAGQPEPPHPFNTLIELVFQGPVQSSLLGFFWQDQNWTGLKFPRLSKNQTRLQKTS